METIRKTINYLSAYWLLIIYGSATWVFMKTGHYPEFCHPDPEDIIPCYESLFVLLSFSTFLILAGIILNLIFVIRKWNFRMIICDVSLIYFVINALLWIINGFVDFFGLTMWFID